MGEKWISKVERLKIECSFYETTAQAYDDFDGRCGYCGQDLVEDRFHYASGTIDHLIPQADFPEGKWFQPNLILSCSICNSLKHGANPCDQAELEKVPVMERTKYYLNCWKRSGINCCYVPKLKSPRPVRKVMPIGGEYA